MITSSGNEESTRRRLEDAVPLQTPVAKGKKEQELEWLQNYSVKFLGCFHHKEWNHESSVSKQSVKLSTKRLARYRLVPRDQCEASNENFGSETTTKMNYGDYVVDLNKFMFTKKIVESQKEHQDYTIVNAAKLPNVHSPPEGSQVLSDEFHFEKLMECTHYPILNNDEQKQKYYAGPYCATQGESVRMGLFLDDTCTVFANEHLMNSVFPSSNKPLIESMDCVHFNQDSQQDQQYQYNNVYRTSHWNQVYRASGKCEVHMPKQVTGHDPIMNACHYLHKHPIVRNDITIVAALPNHSSPLAKIMIGIFAITSFVMMIVVCWLRKKVAAAGKQQARYEKITMGIVLGEDDFGIEATTLNAHTADENSGNADNKSIDLASIEEEEKDQEARGDDEAQ